MKNKFKIITLFMSMMVIIAFASCKTETEYITKEKTVEVEKIVYSSVISETGLYTVYQIQQEKTGGKSIEDYEVFEVEENRTIEAGAMFEDLKKSYEGFTAKILAQNEHAIYVFYDRNTITYTFQTGTEG